MLRLVSVTGLIRYLSSFAPSAFSLTYRLTSLALSENLRTFGAKVCFGLTGWADDASGVAWLVGCDVVGGFCGGSGDGGGVTF